MIQKSELIAYLIESLSESTAVSGVSASLNPDPSSAQSSAQSSLLLTLRFLPRRPFPVSDGVTPGCLVKLRCQGKESYCFIVPNATPYVTRFQDWPVQIVSHRSALALGLLGRMMNETIAIQFDNGSAKQFEILEFH